MRQDTVDSVAKMRRAGVETIAVGVTGSFHSSNKMQQELLDELLNIAGAPERMFEVKDYEALENIKKMVLRETCLGVAAAQGRF